MKNLTSWEIKKFEKVTSTNDVAKHIPNKEAKKIVVVANTQTNGRGRRGNKWVSQSGNLFFSQVFENKVCPSQLAFISSLSLVKTIKSFFPQAEVSIKWPNDVLIDEKKTSGILIETADNGSIIIGTGVNMVTHPQKTQTSYATTCLQELGKIDNNEFLQLYLSIFDKYYNISLDDFSLIREKWLNYAARINQKIKVRLKNSIDEGVFIGIDEQGFLLLKKDNIITKISVAEVFF